MGTRSASRFSPATGPDYSTAVVASCDAARLLIHAHCRLGDYRGAQARLEYALANSICDQEEVRARLRDLHGRAARFLN